MIERTFDPTFLNEVANHPAVRPFIGGEGEADLSSIILDARNITLVTPCGGWILQAILGGVYELHTLFLPEGRGSNYFRLAREALRNVFVSSDALEIVTKCPDDNSGARMAAALMGFRERFRRENAWVSSGDKPICGISYQAMTMDDFMVRDKVLVGVGDSLQQAIAEAGGNYVIDTTLNRLYGLLVLMVRAKQTMKGIGIYNRTAAFAGYPVAVALRDDLIDVRGAIVHVKADGISVLQT